MEAAYLVCGIMTVFEPDEGSDQEIVDLLDEAGDLEIPNWKTEGEYFIARKNWRKKLEDYCVRS